MSSSTSSSDPARGPGGPAVTRGRDGGVYPSGHDGPVDPSGRGGRAGWGGWRTLLFVLAVLVVVEVGVRQFETRLSVDIQHVHAVGDIISDLVSEAEKADERSLLFLGNSLTRRGVDLAVLESELAEHQVADLQLAAVYPDDTSVLDWLYLYQTEAQATGAVPDVVVLSFGFWHLEDRPVNRVQTYRLGRYFVSWQGLSQLYRHDLTTLADRANVLLAKFSAAFANRQRIAERLLSFLPHYQESARIINDIANAAQSGADEPAEKSYARLTRLIAAVEGSGAELVLVAMPTRDGYDLDPRIAEIAASNGSVLVDARDVPGLNSVHFEDNLHLDPATGAKLYSEHAASLLAPILAGLGAVR